MLEEDYDDYEDHDDCEFPIPEHLRTEKSFIERTNDWLDALPELIAEIKETPCLKNQK